MKSFLSGFTITLYDLFGYLTPGLIGLSGIGLFFWAVLDPGLKPDGDLKAVVWAALFLIAYLLGTRYRRSPASPRVWITPLSGVGGPTRL